jgi:hypothetical protein
MQPAHRSPCDQLIRVSNLINAAVFRVCADYSADSGLLGAVIGVEFWAPLGCPDHTGLDDLDAGMRALHSSLGTGATMAESLATAWSFIALGAA